MPPTLLILIMLAVVLVPAGGLVLLGLVRLASATDPLLSDRLHTYALVPEAEAQAVRGRRRSALARMRVRLNAMLSAIGSESLGLQLARANWPMSVPEYVLIRLGSTLVAFVLGWLLARSALSGAGLAVIAYFVPVVLMKRSITQRQTRFANQLVDALVLITGAVRSGHSLLQAFELIAREMKPPISEEFDRVVREVGLGRRLPEALKSLGARLQNGDLDMVVTSIEIQYQVGGNIAVILAAVTDTIRERIRLFGEVRVLTTQQRYSSYLISVLPFAVAGLMFIINPQNMLRLFDPSIRCIPIGALIGIVLGHVIIQRISKIEV
jgi:tight adherence protein B